MPACAPYCGTIPLANNAEGAVAGFYTDPHVVPHGFLRHRDGTFVSFDAPGAGLGHGKNQGTVAYSINDLGIIAGQFEDSSNVYHGFVRSPDNAFTTFDVPGAGTGANQGTLAFNINLEGTTAGSYIDGGNAYHGFVRSPRGEIASFDPPGSIFTEVCQDTCLNLEGAIAGFYLDANAAYHGFVRAPGGGITAIDAPGAGTGVNQGTLLGQHHTWRAPSRDTTSTPTACRTASCSNSRRRHHQVRRSRCAGHRRFFDQSLRAVTGLYVDASGVIHGYSRSERHHR